MKETTAISTDDLNLMQQGFLIGILRERLGLELSELIEMTGLTEETIRSFERGDLTDNLEVLVKVIPMAFEKLNPSAMGAERQYSHHLFSEIFDRCEYMINPDMYDAKACDLDEDEIVFLYQSLVNGKLR